MITIKGVPASEQVTINGEYIVGRDGRIKIPLADVMVNAKGLTSDRFFEAFFWGGICEDSRYSVAFRVLRDFSYSGSCLRAFGELIAFKAAMSFSVASIFCGLVWA